MIGNDFSAEDMRAMYFSMLRIRLIEEAIAERYAAQQMRCPVHLSIGQEAVPVGVCAELRPDDQITLTHRCHAPYLAKGGDLDGMLGELYGKETGCCGGRGGSMHLHDDEAGVLISLPIVGSAVPLAVGAALAMRQTGTDGVAASFFGDGAAEEGAFHESMNFAALKRLPVLFVLENNFYSVYTNLADRQPSRNLAKLAEAHGMAVSEGDGNDVVAVRRLAREAVARARRGEGSTLMVFDTYRWREHCGPNYDNDIGYRTEGEFLDWKARCPLVQMRKALGDALPASEDRAIADRIHAEIDGAFARAEAAPFPDPATAVEKVFA